MPRTKTQKAETARKADRVPPSPPPGRSLALVFISTVLFLAMGAALAYIYRELDRSRECIAAMEERAGAEDPSAALDKYLDKAAEIVKLDMAEQVKVLSLRFDDKLDAVRRNSVVRSDMDAISRRVDSLEDFNRSHAGKSLALLALASSVKDAVAAGRSLKAPLDAISGIARDDVHVMAQVEALRQFENAGLPSDAAVLAEFDRSAADMVFNAKSPLPDDAQWYRRWLRKIRGLVKIRRLDASADTPDGLVLAIGAGIRDGDWPAAAAAYERLGIRDGFGDRLRGKAAASVAASEIFRLALSNALGSLDK